MISTPASSASPGTSPEKRHRLKSQAQKFQPRRIVPMTSPIKEPPTSLEPPGGEGPSRVPTPAEETSPVQPQVPQPDS